MVDYKKLLSKIEKEKREIKRQSTFIPSQLDSSTKKRIKFNLSERKQELSDKKKGIKESQKEEKISSKKREQLLKKVEKALQKRLVSRKVLKKSQATMVIPNYKAESNFGSSSSFFKQEMEDTKGIFFS
jgi:YesN/AraC family two-component response regulator